LPEQISWEGEWGRGRLCRWLRYRTGVQESSRGENCVSCRLLKVFSRQHLDMRNFVSVALNNSVSAFPPIILSPTTSCTPDLFLRLLTDPLPLLQLISDPDQGHGLLLLLTAQLLGPQGEGVGEEGGNSLFTAGCINSACHRSLWAHRVTLEKQYRLKCEWLRLEFLFRLYRSQSHFVISCSNAMQLIICIGFASCIIVSSDDYIIE
jgi:hypothetical protein